MLKRVSEEQKIHWMSEEAPIERTSMNRGAMDAFSSIVVAQAKKLQQEGKSLKAISSQFKIKEDVLADMMTDKPCPCAIKTVDASKQIKSDHERMLDDAENVHKQLHSVRDKDLPSLPNISAKRIIPNKGNDVMDTGGPLKQMGSIRNNSIFDTNIIERAAKEQTNDEKIRATKLALNKKREDIRNIQRYETIDGQKFEDALKANSAKDISVFTASQKESHNYNAKMPQNGISIFDNGAFDRVPEKTKGDERRVELAKEASKPKDRSWVESGSKPSKSKTILDQMIESLLKDNNA